MNPWNLLVPSAIALVGLIIAMLFIAVDLEDSANKKSLAKKSNLFDDRFATVDEAIAFECRRHNQLLWGQIVCGLIFLGVLCYVVILVTSSVPVGYWE